MLGRAIVVGASSGIGAALVRELATSGYRVVATARREEALRQVAEAVDRDLGEQRVHVVVNDVTDLADVPRAFQEAVDWLDGLDLVVYASGVMPRIDEQTFDTAVDARIVAVNVTGAMAWLNEAARRLSVAGGGAIVGIGSVAGDRGRVGNPAYCASKAALHTYLEALRNRLGPKGVRVLTVKPGPVDTPMVAGRDKLPLLIPPDKAARAIVRAVGGGPTTVYVPLAWWPIMTAIRAVPSPLFQKLGI